MAADRSEPSPWLDTRRATASAARPSPLRAAWAGRSPRTIWAAGAAVVLLGVGAAAFWAGTLQAPDAEPGAGSASAPVRKNVPTPTPTLPPKSTVPVIAQATILPVPVAEAPPPPVGAMDPMGETDRPETEPSRPEARLANVPGPLLSNRVRERLRVVRAEAKREGDAMAARDHRPTGPAVPRVRFALVPPGPVGRIVQLGSYPDIPEAQAQWRGVAARWPYLTTKPRILAPVWMRQENGWALTYRLQIGTSSQAQSAVICQRLQKARQPCVVVY